jgi:hypothetical protein
VDFDGTGEGSAEELQADLLRYRLEQHARVCRQEFRPPLFSSGPALQLARCVGGCIDEAPILAALMEALAGLDEQARVARAGELPAIVVEALLVFCHEKRGEVRAGELADTANAILAGRGERLAVRPRQMGALLAELGFTTVRLGSHGRGLRLDPAVRGRAHQLAGSHAVCSPPLAGCAECAALRAGAPAAGDAHHAHDARRAPRDRRVN